jgi:hypothetical protein
MATALETQFLNEINSQFGQNFASLNDYFTAKGVKGMATKGKRQERWKNFQVSRTGGEGQKIDSKEKAARQAFVDSPDWLAFVEDGFGWLVNIYKSVPEVAQIIRDEYVNGTPAADIARKVSQQSDWARGLQAGEYAYLKGTTTNDRAFLDTVATRETQVRTVAQTGGYSLSDNQVKFLAASSLKGNWDDATLGREVDKAIAAGAQPGTKPGTTTLQAGADAASIRSTARSYGIALADSQVELYTQGMLKGEYSAQQIKDLFRNQAKSLYPSVAAQLDSGTLDDAVSTYKNIAAQVLEIDPTSVDFTDPQKFGKLLTYQDPKTNEARLMNATEWTGYLRRLPEWQKTETAKKTYDDLIKSVDKIFGKAR